MRVERLHKLGLDHKHSAVGRWRLRLYVDLTVLGHAVEGTLKIGHPFCYVGLWPPAPKVSKLKLSLAHLSDAGGIGECYVLGEMRASLRSVKSLGPGRSRPTCFPNRFQNFG